MSYIHIYVYVCHVMVPLKEPAFDGVSCVFFTRRIFQRSRREAASVAAAAGRRQRGMAWWATVAGQAATYF